VPKCWPVCQSCFNGYCGISGTCDISDSNSGITDYCPRNYDDRSGSCCGTREYSIHPSGLQCALCPTGSYGAWIGRARQTKCTNYLEDHSCYKSRHSRSTHMLCDMKSLSGTIPDGIGDLTGLTHIKLHQNDLIGTIPPTLAKLTQLTWLELWGNKLTGCVPKCLPACPMSDLGLHQLAGNGCYITNYDSNPGINDYCQTCERRNEKDGLCEKWTTSPELTR